MTDLDDLFEGALDASLAGRTLFITGASRGIGRAIALRAAQDGANIAVAAKSDKPHPKLPGTIHDAAEEIEGLGGKALALKCDVRDEHAVKEAVDEAAAHFGGLDILVNNASAIMLKGTAELPVRRFDLMFQVNARATFACTQAALPHLLKADNPHVLNLAPPPSLDPRWFKRHAPYTITKYGMSLLAMGLAEEYREQGLAANALWPKTVIATAAIRMLGDMVDPENCRIPEIVADAAHAILTRPATRLTGQFLVDEDVLRAAGVTDFDRYAVAPGQPLAPDLFLDDA